MYIKDLFIAEATIQKQHVNEGICQEILPFLLALLTIVKNDLIIAW